MNLLIDGIELDIMENPTGGTAREAAREVIEDYHLHELDLRSGDVVIDIGANVGVSCLYLAKKYPGITIYAFEPAPETLCFLLPNIQRNDVVNVVAIGEAVAGVIGRRMLYGNPGVNSGGVSLFTESWDDAYYLYTVNTTTLAEIMRRFEIDRVALLKLDCEFAEYEIIMNSLDILPRIDRVRGEFHKSERYAGLAENCLEMLEGRIPDVHMQIREIVI